MLCLLIAAEIAVRPRHLQEYHTQLYFTVSYTLSPEQPRKRALFPSDAMVLPHCDRVPGMKTSFGLRHDRHLDWKLGDGWRVVLGR